MLNLRRIDRFFLSGGWQNASLDDYNYFPSDIRTLASKRIGFVLDLQFTPIDEIDNTIETLLAGEGIGYRQVDMYDGEYNRNLAGIFDETANLLAEVEIALPLDKNILIKCAVGVSRSPAVLINYLCISRRMTYDEALNYVRKQERKSFGLELGVMIDSAFVRELRKRYPETVSAFGERE